MAWGSNLNQCDKNNKLQLYLSYSVSYLQMTATKKYNKVRLMLNALMNSQNDTPHVSPLHTTLPYSEGLIQVPNTDHLCTKHPHLMQFRALPARHT